MITTSWQKSTYQRWASTNSIKDNPHPHSKTESAPNHFASTQKLDHQYVITGITHHAKAKTSYLSTKVKQRKARRHSLTNTNYAVQFPTLRVSCKDLHILNATDKPRYGKNIFAIMVFSLPGNITLSAPHHPHTPYTVHTRSLGSRTPWASLRLTHTRDTQLPTTPPHSFPPHAERIVFTQRGRSSSPGAAIFT